MQTLKLTPSANKNGNCCAPREIQKYCVYFSDFFNKHISDASRCNWCKYDTLVKPKYGLKNR